MVVRVVNFPLLLLASLPEPVSVREVAVIPVAPGVVGLEIIIVAAQHLLVLGRRVVRRAPVPENVVL